MTYEHLFRPGTIGSLRLKNRAVMMPMATEMADRFGLPTDRQIKYYQARAKGGAALIIHESTGVADVDSIPAPHTLRAAQDYHIPALEKLTDAVHLYDCKIVAQLHHGGATSNPALTGRQNIAPSAVPIAEGRPMPREMTLEDIRRVQGKFIAAAVRCQKAGYDGVELHGAHGYLIAQFFSKYYNRRTDEYGGSAENRCRFLTEIIAGIREKLGRFPILVRMCGDEMTPIEGFLSLEEGIEIARVLEGAGIDAINISNGSSRNADANCEPFSYAPGWKKHVAKAYKAALHIPVIATNTIKDPAFAEELLAEGVSDFVGLGRSQLADPDFVNKARAGRTVRSCIGCLYCRERVLAQGLSIRCAVNPRTGREIDFPSLSKNGGGRTAVVVGGGPAGMEAAMTLARRDFRVILFEENEALGGALRTAALPPHKENLLHLAETMEEEVRALGVEVHTGTRATVEDVQALDPAGVVLAVGARPIIPDLPGMDLSHVVTAEDVLTGKAAVSGKTVIIGSGLTGLETAEVLLTKGTEVALVEMQDQLGPGVFPAIRNDELSRSQGSEAYTSHQLLAVEKGCVVLKRLTDGETVTVPADTVILAMGVRPPAELEEWEVAFPTLRRVGDANGGGRIAHAIRQGFEAGYTME